MNFNPPPFPIDVHYHLIEDQRRCCCNPRNGKHRAYCPAEDAPEPETAKVNHEEKR